MVAGNSPDWLPAGWTELVKVKNGRKIKYYSNMETGQKFYSKNDMIRYVEMGNICHDTPQQNSDTPQQNSDTPQQSSEHNNKRRLKDKAMPLALKTSESPEGLPHGWIMELRTRNSGARIGTKYKVYIDPLTGRKFFSKPQVFEYLRTPMPSGCTSQQKKMDIGSVSNASMGELTGGKTSLKLEGSQNLETLKGTSCGSNQKKIGFRKQSGKKVVIEKFTPDGLPPGWIKEIKIEKKANGIRKDPYYTDPVSGYVFRSQKDALRYLETGDFNTCAIKPKKRDELGFLNEETSLPSAAGHHSTRRQLFAGTENSVKRSLEPTDAEGSQKRQCMSESGDAMIASNPAADILEGKHSLDNAIEERAETKESHDPSSSPLPSTEGSEGKQGICAENGTVSAPSTEMVQDEKLAENSMGKNSNRKIRTDSSKSKKKTALSLPCRSSKRVAGLKPEMVVNSALSERVLRAVARNPGESEGKLSLGALENVAHGAPQPIESVSETQIAHHTVNAGESGGKLSMGALENLAHGTPQPFETVSETHIADHTVTGTEAPNVGLSNKRMKPLEDQAVPEDQPMGQETEKKVEENLETQLGNQFGDSWSDPCLEFAFKTLTGAIPLEDNLEIQDYFQQQADSSHTQGDGNLVLPEFGLPNCSQSDISSDFVAPGNPLSVTQLPANPTFLPAVNVSLPSYSGNAPQQPNLEGNKEYQTKVN